MSSLIINHLHGIETKSYLELGVDNGHNISSIHAGDKWSVDINGRAHFTGTTDEWFTGPGLNKKFDIIFIDANHDYDYALRDFNHSVHLANEWILVHDMIPPTLEYSKSRYCSDSYKILYHLLKYTSFQVYPMNTNFGLTLIKMPAGEIYPDESTKNLSWYDFDNWVKGVKLYSEAEIVKIISCA